MKLTLQLLTFFSFFFFGKIIYADPTAQQSDIPILSSVELLGCNPLKGFKFFAIHPQYSVTSPELRAKVNEEVSKELSKIGKIVKLKVDDVTGYGKAEGLLTMSILDILTPEGEKPGVMQVSLLLSATTSIKKTGTQCSTYIWNASQCTKGALDDNDASNLLSCINALLGQFIDDYNAANAGQKDKPTIFLYLL